MSKSKRLNIALILCSLIGYLEWGEDQSTFLIMAELDIIKGLFTNISSVVHPLTFIPLIGQILLLITLFQKKVSKLLTYFGMISLFLLLGLMFFISIIDFNLKILASTLPYIITMVMVFFNLKKGS